LKNISKKWTMPIHDWSGAINQFAILFENRLPNSSFTNSSFTQSFNTLMLERDLAAGTKPENFTLPDLSGAQQSLDKLKAKTMRFWFGFRLRNFSRPIIWV